MNPNMLYKSIAIFALVVLLALVLVTPANAFEGRGGDTVTIASGEVVEDDLYVGAGTFTLNGTVKGDLVVFGQTITINGVVEGDLMAGGQSVIINGQVQDDARIAGAVLMLGDGASVGGDIMSAGFSLETRPDSAVGGDVVFAGGQMLHAGGITGNLDAGVGGLELRGSVNGNVEASVGSAEDVPPFSPTIFMPGAPSVPTVSGGLTLREGAEIGGDLEYTSGMETSIPAGAVGGRIAFREPPIQPEEAAARLAETFGTLPWFLRHLRTLVTLLLVGLLMVWLAPNFVNQGASTMQSRPLPSLGWGLVSIFAVFFVLLVLIAVVILLAIIFGVVTLGDLVGTTIWLGILAAFTLLLGFSLAVTYVTKILVSYLGGKMVLARLKPEWNESRVWPLVIGLVIFVILAAIPFLGGLVSLIVVLLGLGALWILGRDVIRPRQRMPAESI